MEGLARGWEMGYPKVEQGIGEEGGTRTARYVRMGTLEWKTPNGLYCDRVPGGFCCACSTTDLTKHR